MKTLRRLSMSILVLAALLSLATSLALAAPPAQDPEAGRVAWEQNLCKNCHGEGGEGIWGAPLAGSEKTAEEWVAQVRSPRQRMPHFSMEQVSDQTVIDMHAYLTTLSKPASFTPADAGLPADAHPGQQLLVEKRCVACHTTTGPVTRFTSRGETPTAEAVITQLRTPLELMPAFSVEQVSDEEAGLIADFLASQVSPAGLPETGEARSTGILLVLMLLGSGLAAAGFLLRRKVTV